MFLSQNKNNKVYPPPPPVNPTRSILFLFSKVFIVWTYLCNDIIKRKHSKPLFQGREPAYRLDSCPYEHCQSLRNKPSITQHQLQSSHSKCPYFLTEASIKMLKSLSIDSNKYLYHREIPMNIFNLLRLLLPIY